MCDVGFALEVDFVMYECLDVDLGLGFVFRLFYGMVVGIGYELAHL